MELYFYYLIQSQIPKKEYTNEKKKIRKKLENYGHKNANTGDEYLN